MVSSTLLTAPSACSRSAHGKSLCPSISILHVILKLAMTGHFAPSRQVLLDGAVNVRDIGGYRSAYGPWVVRGRLFRGDALCQLSGADSDAIRGPALRHG